MFLTQGTHISSVAESSVKGPSAREEEISDISETSDLKNFWLLFDHLPAKTHTRIQLYCYQCVEMFVCRCVCVCRYAYLCNAEKRLLGASSTGPLGRTVPLSLTHSK